MALGLGEIKPASNGTRSHTERHHREIGGCRGILGSEARAI